MTRFRSAPRAALAVTLLVLTTAAASAHDVWVQTNVPLARVGDAVHVDLMLGNHGNNHRDYKLASKAGLAGMALDLIDPDGRRTDLTPSLVDVGLDPKEGFRTARVVGRRSGLFTVAEATDKVVNHGTPARTLGSGKCYVLFADSLDEPTAGSPKTDHAKPLGHPLELVPVTHPVLGVGPGEPVRVRLLFRGKPLAGARVAFIPRGEVLADGVDPEHEPVTDENGEATFTPSVGTYHLVAARHTTDDAGDGYARTSYVATLSLLVPERPFGPAR